MTEPHRAPDGATGTPSGEGGATASPPGVTDRVAGGILVLLGIAVGAEASTFEVAFLTDPVGPKALPYLAAAIFVVAGAVLLTRPGVRRSWPRRGVLLRMGGAVVAFGAYAAVLAPLGFTVSTTLAVGTLSVLFGGPWRRSFGAALTLSVVLWYLFVWVLGLPLPLGSVWRAVASAAGVGG
ncbi:MAG: tripartite tricarboxylate transporter TctB family protein [Gemmatimonadota bacterium]